MQTDCEQLDRMKWTALHHNGNRHCWPGFKGQKILLYIIAVIFPHCLQSKQLEHRTERNGIFYALSGHYGGVSVTNVSEDRIAADFCIGSSNNGWLVWKDKDGQTLDAVYRKQLE